MAESPPKPVPKQRVNTLGRVLSAAALFLTLFLFVRTVALEPFGVPTGSMAGTMLGNHREAACPRCGYAVVVGDPNKPDRSPPYADAFCPNCGKRNLDLSSAREIPGDRLLVDKNVFDARNPRRWEAAVFYCPADEFKPYVKRVVGLPNESVRVQTGDVWIDGQLARKSLPQLREVWIPVYTHDAAPPEGWGLRWVVEPVAGSPRLPAGPVKDAVADAKLIRPGAICLDGTTAAVGLTYRNWNLDTKLEEPVRDLLGYNGSPRRSWPRPVSDFAVRFKLEIAAGTGTFAVRLGDGLDTVTAELPVGGPGTAKLGRDGGDPPAAANIDLAVGSVHLVEIAFADRRAYLAVDGKEVVPAVDLPADAVAMAKRSALSRPVQLGVRGADVVLREFQLLRDIHYRNEGKHAATSDCKLGPDDYFMLGDNSGNSHDSREWPVPGVPGREFLGKPFLIHQPQKLGRVTVNGQDKTFLTPDWDRMKWMR